jgi:hypothetical protein
MYVARALLTDPLDRDPTVHLYYDNHVPWLAVNDDCPRDRVRRRVRPHGTLQWASNSITLSCRPETVTLQQSCSARSGVASSEAASAFSPVYVNAV